MENKFKNATKRITAIAATAALVSSSVFGVSLSDYPNNFVSSGALDAQVVIGDNADSAAATSIITDLASELGGGEKVKITAKMVSSGGAILSAVDDKKTLNFADKLVDVAEKLDDDSTMMLKTSDVKGDDYTQTLEFLNGDFDYRIFDEIEGEVDIKDGLYYGSGTSFAKYTLDFEDVLELNDGAVDVSSKIEGNSIEIMGNEFTIVEIEDTKLVLVGGANKISLGEGESTTVSVDGVSYEVKIQSVSDGGSSGDGEVLLTVNGETVSVDEGDVEDVAGISLAVTDLVASGRDSVKGYASLVVGGQKITFENNNVEINGEDLNDIYPNYRFEIDFGYMAGGNTDALKFEGIEITYQVEGNQLLEEGSVLEDVLFNSFIMTYDGLNVGSDDYSTFKISSSKDQVTFLGNTEDGDALPGKFKLTADASDDGAANTPDNTQIYLGTDIDRIYFANSDLSFEVIEDGNNDAITDGVVTAVVAVKTITTSAALSASNIMSVTVNNNLYTETFATSNDATLTALAAKIQADNDVTTATVTPVGGDATDDRVIVVTAANAGTDIVFTSLAVAGGSAVTVTGATTTQNVVAGGSVMFELAEATSDVLGNVFFSRVADDEFYLYEVSSIKRDSGTPADSEVDYKDLFSSSKVNTVKADETQSDLELFGSVFTSSGGNLTATLSNLGTAEIALENYLIMDFDNVEHDNLIATGGDTSILTFRYNVNDIDIDDSGFTTNTFDVEIARKSATDIDLPLKLSIGGTNNFIADDDLNSDSDYHVYVDHYGTKVTVEEDNWDDITISVPNKEVTGSVSVNFGGAAPQVSTYTVDASMSAAKVKELEDDGYSVTTETVTTSAVSVDISAPVMAGDVTGMSDMIVVGGPAINVVAAKLLGVGFPAYGSASGLEAGEAVVRYFSNSNSILVYGWDAAGTSAAANKLNSGGLTGTEFDVQ